MIILDSNKSIEVVLSSAVATNQLPCFASWLDISSSFPEMPGSNNVNTNGITEVTLVTSPGVSYLRRIKYINIYNKDTAVAEVEIALQESVEYILVKITLQVGDTLIYEDGNGWSVIDKFGQSRTGGSIITEPKVNLLINGGFDFAQRQAPGTLTTYSTTTGRLYGADRWGMTNENASVQYQRVDTASAPETGLTAQYYGKFKKITSAGKVEVSQVVEGRDSMPVRGRTVRLQAKMKYSVAGSMTVRLALVQLTSAGTIDTIPATFISAHGAVGTDPTLGTNLSYITPVTAEGGSISGNAITCVLTSSWVRYSGTFLAPTNHKNLIALIFTNGQPAANDELNVSEIGLYDGSDIVDWVPTLVYDELERCQRYYTKTFGIDTNPVQNNGIDTGEFNYASTKTGAAGTITGWYKYPATMRIAPATRTTYNPAAANIQVRNRDIAADCSATGFFNVGIQGAGITCTGNAGGAVGSIHAVHLSFDAEL